MTYPSNRSDEPMVTDPRAAIRTILDDSEPLAALRILQHAFDWAAMTVVDALARTSGEPGTDLATLELVIALDEALEPVSQLTDRVPALTEQALAGGPVREHLQTRLGALTDLGEQIVVIRHEYEALEAVEAELLAAATEHERLSAQLADVERLRKLADALPELRSQHDSLTRRHGTMLTDAADAEQALLDTAGEVLLLSVERQTLLSERLRIALSELQTAESEWATTLGEYTRAQTKVGTLRNEHHSRAIALDAHAGIDRDLLQRLSHTLDHDVLHYLRDELDALVTRLEHIEDALGTALRQYDALTRSENQTLPWHEDS